MPSSTKPYRPSTIKIGPQTFDIEFRDPNHDGMLNDGSHGYTLDAGNLIVVSTAISLSKQKITLFHEILHACRMVFESMTASPRKEGEYEDWEHYFIGIWETSLLMTLRDNPEIAEWLMAD